MGAVLRVVSAVKAALAEAQIRGGPCGGQAGDHRAPDSFLPGAVTAWPSCKAVTPGRGSGGLRQRQRRQRSHRSEL